MKWWTALRLRNRILIIVGVVLVVVAVAAVIIAVSQPEIPTAVAEIRTAVVLLVEGLVEVRTGEAESFIDALVDMLLSSSDEMRTGEDGRSVLELDNGMVVVVSPNSVFYVEEMAGEPENAVTRFILNAGEVFSISSETLPEGASYEIETPVGIIGVRGSAMSAAYDPDTGSVEATCLTGECSVRTDTEEVDLTGNQAISATETAGIVGAPVPLTVEQLARWAEALEVAERAGVGNAFWVLCQCSGIGLVCDDGAYFSAYVGCGAVTRNADWMPVIQDFDGVEMALVPAGCFMMGSTEEEIDDALESCEETLGEGSCDRVWFESEAPQHEVCFEEPFWIDVYEVANGQYGSSGEWSGSDLPRETLTWFEAVAHCEGRGARLPTEAEWEYAARGPDGLVYPWGNVFDGARLNYCDSSCEDDWADTGVNDGYPHTAPVGSYPGGVSWVGAYDLSGNVWEWIADWYGTYSSTAQVSPTGPGSGDERGVHGGGWLNIPAGACAAYRLSHPPDHANSHLGFRCALSE